MRSAWVLATQYKRLSYAVGVLIVAVALQLMGHASWSYGLIAGYSVAVALILCIGMVRDIFGGRYGVDVIAIVAIISTLAIGEYWASLIIVFMMTGGEALEDFASNRAKSELTELLKRVPKIAHKQMVDGSIVDVPIDDVGLHDNIVIRPGEVVPVDAVVVTGASSLDESSLTGESEPVDVGVGDDIMSGVVNGESPLMVRTMRVAKDSQYAQIVRLVKAAGETKAPFVRLADQYAVPFTIAAFAIGGIAWWVSGDARRFAEVLVVATPCPLLLAAPIALISGMSRSAKQGIIVKNGGVLERLAAVKTVAFDKTGTLTTGKLSVEMVLPAKGTAEEELLGVCASAEQTSGHVTALAIMDEARRRHVTVDATTGSVEVPGGGIRCTINRHVVLAGKRDFLIKHGVAAASIPEHVKTATYVAQSGRFLGLISYADTIRPESKKTLTMLRKLGVERFIMLTGDHQSTAEAVASHLGITDIHANCLPKDKLEIVRDFPIRPVMMAGDGVNDAPVLAASDVGVAMGARGATAASESADVVIMVDSILRVASAIDIAKRTMHIATQSVLVGIALSVILMIIASIGLIPPIVGAVLQEVVDVIVILNALRAHTGRSVGLRKL